MSDETIDTAGSETAEAAEIQETALDTTAEETTSTEETQEPVETEEQEGETGAELEGDISTEGEEPPEEGAEDANKDLSLDDDSVLKLGDQEYTLAAIKEALEFKTHGAAKVQEAEQRVEQANGVLKALTEKPADALLGIFTSVFQGDRKKAYESVVNLAAKIVNKHMEFESLPEAERKALTLEQELSEARQRLQTYEQTEQQKTVQAEEKAALEKWNAAITGGLKAGGVKETPANIRRVADAILLARQSKKPITVEQAVASVKAEIEAEKAELRKELAAENIAKAKAKRSPGASSPAPEAKETDEEPEEFDAFKFNTSFGRRNA